MKKIGIRMWKYVVRARQRSNSDCCVGFRESQTFSFYLLLLLFECCGCAECFVFTMQRTLLTGLLLLVSPSELNRILSSLLRCSMLISALNGRHFVMRSEMLRQMPSSEWFYCFILALDRRIICRENVWSIRIF